MYAVITTVTIIRSAKITSAGCSHVIHFTHFTYFPPTYVIFFSHFINQQFRCHLSHSLKHTHGDDHLLYNFSICCVFIAIENSTIDDSLVFFGGEITYISIFISFSHINGRKKLFHRFNIDLRGVN